MKPSETFHTSFPSHGCGSSPGSCSLHSPGRSSEKQSPPPALCLAAGWDPRSNETQGHAGHLAIHCVESRGVIYRGLLRVLAEEGGLSPLTWLWRSTEGVASWPTPQVSSQALVGGSGTAFPLQVLISVHLVLAC